jgi:hypothetical protein
MRQIGIGAAEIEVEFEFGMGSPFLCEGADLAFERPGVARLLINLPIGLRDRSRPHQPARIEVGEGRFPLPLLDPLARGVDTRIDDQLRDMDAFRAKLACSALGDGAQPCPFQARAA